MSGPGASATTESLYKQSIPSQEFKKTIRKIWSKKKSIQEPDNPSKRAKEDSIPDEE